MPINCAYADCPSNLYSIKHGAKNEYTSSFRFPLGKPDLLKKWIAFTMRADFQPSTYSSLCCTHFEDRYIFTGPKLKRLNWKLNPVPTIHTATMTASFSEKPSLEPTVVHERKPPTNRRPIKKGEWLKDQILTVLASLTEAGFNVRAVVADNHSTNVSAFKRPLLSESTVPTTHLLLLR